MMHYKLHVKFKVAHSVVEKHYKKRDHAQKIPWNQLFSNNVDLTEK